MHNIPASHTSQKFPQTGKIIDFGNISQPGENLLTGHRLLWFKLGEYTVSSCVDVVVVVVGVAHVATCSNQLGKKVDSGQ